MEDFFISYTNQDRSWAEWIAWVLEESGYRVVIQAWDFRPGGNFVLDMQRATGARRTIAVLSSLYLDKPFPQSEWAAAFAQDPTSHHRKLIPVRVENCSPLGLLAQIVYVDIFDCEETEAQTQLLNAVQRDRMKPEVKPLFPIPAQERVVPRQAPFPRSASSSPAPGSSLPLPPPQKDDFTPEQIEGFEENFKKDYFKHLETKKRLNSGDMIDQQVNINLPDQESIFTELGLVDTAPSESNNTRSTYERNQSGLDLEQLPTVEKSSKQQTVWFYLANASTTPKYRRLIILAQGGFGKSSLLKHIVRSYALPYAGRTERVDCGGRRPDLFPVLLLLGEGEGKIIPSGELLQIIKQDIIENIWGNFQMPSNYEANLSEWLEGELNSGKVLVMLDGFDELPSEQRAVVCQWLDVQMRNYFESVFILTSRWDAYVDHSINSLYKLWLTGFEFGDQQKFIQQWYRVVRLNQAEEPSDNLIEQISRERRLREMAESPFLLNKIVQIHCLSNGGRVPTERVQLYQKFCQLQLERRPLNLSFGQVLSCKEQQDLLEVLALEIVQGELSTIQQQEAIRILQSQPVFCQRENISQEALLRAMLDFLQAMVDGGWLRHSRDPVGCDDDEYEFIYPSFHGYLAERRIRFLPPNDFLLQGLRDSLLNPLKKDCRREIVLFYVAQATQQDFTNLIQELCNLAQQANNSTEATNVIAALAYDCKQESIQEVDDNLDEELYFLRYQALRTYLQNKDWKNAEKETYRRMIQVVGKEEGPWFSTEDLRNFPAKELRDIDALWVKHSDGRFGFSVQRRIYLECVGSTDVTHNPRAWREFCERVGWRDKDGQWVNKLTFDSNTPKGHFPLYPPPHWAFMLHQGGAIFSNRAWES